MLDDISAVSNPRLCSLEIAKLTSLTGQDLGQSELGHVENVQGRGAGEATRGTALSVQHAAAFPR